MSQVALPPRPPPVTLADGGGIHRLNFRLWQVFVTVLTVLATAWLVIVGPALSAIIGLVVAKHILVALLCMGLDLYPVKKPEP